MKALVFTEKETLSYQDEPNSVAKGDEEIIKINAAGICGSDMHAYHGLDERRLPPLILGHEISGFKVKNNDPVVINPLVTCGSCNECFNGREHLCPNRGLIGMKKPILRQGGFAEFVSVPNQNIFSVPHASNLNELVLTEPTAVAYHAFKIAEKYSFKKIASSKILIIGGGAIGLLLGLVLKLENVKDITIIDTNEKRLNVCYEASSIAVAHPNENSIKQNNYNIVFDAVGFEATRQKSIASVCQGGIIVHIGLSQGSGEFDFRKTTLQEIGFIGAYCYTNKDFKISLDLLIKKKLGDLSWLDFRKLEDGDKAFKEIHDGSTSSPKIILQP